MTFRQQLSPTLQSLIVYFTQSEEDFSYKSNIYQGKKKKLKVMLKSLDGAKLEIFYLHLWHCNVALQKVIHRMKTYAKIGVLMQ